jgi:YVTN family beta-propeller protein
MYRIKLQWLSILFVAAPAMLLAASTRADESVPLYTITKVIPLGLPDRWDYLTFDATSSRIYVAHGTAIDVLDGQSGAVLGKVDVSGANGVAVVPSSGKGYAGSSVHKSVVEFDLKTFQKIKELPADEDTDGVVFDDFSKRIFVMDGDPHNITVIDTATDTAITKIPLHGQPEFAAVDGAGKLFVNITDAREVQRVDAKTLKVDATWSVAECERPLGMSIDRRNHRLFVSCLNSKMVILDASNGHILTTLPIGKGTDASAFDAARGLAFSSNGSGTLSVIREEDPDKFVGLGEVPTQLLARTMALDSVTGRIYLIAADRVEVDATASDPRKRYGIRPGTVRLLFLDPAKPRT